MIAWQFFATCGHFLTAYDAYIVTLLEFFRSGIWIAGNNNVKKYNLQYLHHLKMRINSLGGTKAVMLEKEWNTY